MTELEKSIKRLMEHTQHYVPTEDLEHLYAVIEAAEKLKEYETAEEEGRLMMLPVGIGDEVYIIEKCSNIPEQLDGTLYDSDGWTGTATGIIAHMKQIVRLMMTILPFVTTIKKNLLCLRTM